MQIDEKDFQSFITIKKNLATQSVRHCLIRLRVVNKWLNGRELTKELVEEFFLTLKNKGQRNSSLNTYYFVFRQISDYLKDRGKSNNFLLGFTSFKKEKPDIVVLTIGEIEELLKTTVLRRKLKSEFDLDFIYKTLTMFIAYTGCRFSEAANLKINNLDLSAGRATFIETKTNENRTTYFTEPLISNLKSLIKNRDLNTYVFENSKGRVHPQDFINDLRRRAEKAEITKRVYPHLLRHSYITHMLESGVPITEVATLVGHRDIQTTYSTYMHLADQTLKKAAMRNPLLIRNVDPVEILRTIKETVEAFHIEKDTRFFYDFLDQGNKIEFRVSTKNEG
jgi:integrase